MLLPDNIHPGLSIYYNGSFVFGELKKMDNQTIMDLYQNVKVKNEMSFPTFMLCLDWLYLIEVAKMDESGYIQLLDDLEDETGVILNREIFENKIWEDIIRNNRKRKNNMPTRRENVLLFITMEMLKNENYQYEIQSNDDHDAFGDLEKAGILN